MRSFLKFLSRNKLYTAIEAVGLAVSLAFVILIGISIADQLRIRRDTPPGTNLYSIGPDSYGTEYRNLESLSSIPEIKSLAAFKRIEFLALLDGDKDLVMAMIADPGIVDYVPQHVIEGDIELFRNGSGVLITESAARKFFPDKDPLGEYVTIANIGVEGEEETPVSEQIVAVIGDPSYSILDDFDLMLSFRSKIPAVVEIVESDLFNTGNGQFVNVLADMQPEFDMEGFSAKYLDLFEPYVIKGDKEKPMATAFTDIFFSPDSYEGLRQGNRLYISVLVILGLILLLSAILNYVNLNLAVSGERAKEMATRQLVGASRKSVVLKGIAESMVFTLVCFAFAVLLAEWLVPLLNGLRPEGLTIPFHIPFNGTFFLISLALVVVIGFLSGIIPAMVMASYRPLDVVTGQVRRKRKMGINQVFIVFQTVLSVLFIVASISVEAQLRFMLKQDIGTAPVKNLYHFFPGIYEPIMDIGNALTANPQVNAIGYGTGYPTKSWGIQTGPPGAFYSFVQCDSTAFRMLGFRIMEQWGESVPGTFWLTEEARNYIGVTEEDSAPSRLWGDYPNPDVTSIGGVVENFRGYPVNDA
ncbi:MAG: FtsX-like permease family protein, partial [Bacteroidales bacterium]|nr:FtsX-like permease family protein [Bacteroidales bacterium]